MGEPRVSNSGRLQQKTRIYTGLRNQAERLYRMASGNPTRQRRIEEIFARYNQNMAAVPEIRALLNQGRNAEAENIPVPYSVYSRRNNRR